MSVSFTELSDAFQFVRAGHNEENQAYLCKQSGKIYCHSEFVPDLDELPGDIDDEEKYLRIPTRETSISASLSCWTSLASSFPMISIWFEIFFASGAAMGNSRFWWCEEASSIGGTTSR